MLRIPLIWRISQGGSGYEKISVNTEHNSQQQTRENFAPTYDEYLKCGPARVEKQRQISKLTRGYFIIIQKNEPEMYTILTYSADHKRIRRVFENLKYYISGISGTDISNSF